MNYKMSITHTNAKNQLIFAEFSGIMHLYHQVHFNQLFSRKNFSKKLEARAVGLPGN